MSAKKYKKILEMLDAREIEILVGGGEDTDFISMNSSEALDEFMDQVLSNKTQPTYKT